MRHTSLALVIVAVLLSGCQAALLRGVSLTSGATPADARNAVYQPATGLALDVYEPPTAPTACVVFFYGGSWRSGHRDWYRFVGRSLADRGYRTLIPDYRKAPQVTFPAFIDDGAGAVAAARSRHCRGNNGTPLPLFVMGHSAGAHIAALLATDARYLARVGLRPTQLAGFIGLAGPYDFLPMTDPAVIAVFNGNPTLRDSQPIHFADGDEPPMLLLHGGKDDVVFPKNSLNLATATREHGGIVDTVIYPDGGHIGLLLALRPGSKHPLATDLSRFVDRRVQAAGALQPETGQSKR